MGCSRVTHRASWDTAQEASAFPAPGAPLAPGTAVVPLKRGARSMLL